MPEPTLEWEFGRACLVGQWAPEERESAGRLAGQAGFDPQKAVELADEEGVAPLLHTLLGGRNLLPDSAAQFLARCYYQNQARSTLLFRELEQILDELARRKIEVVLLKGAALDSSLYPQPGLRIMGDLDLLVHPEQLEEAMRVVEDLGFRRHEVAWRPGWNARLMHHQSYAKSDPYPIEVEIHWRLLAAFYEQIQARLPWFWQNTEPIAIGQARALRFNSLAQALHLVSHIYVHERIRLMWLYDLAQVMRTAPDFDWDELLNQAGQAGLVLPLQELLPILRKEWQVDVPPSILARLDAALPERGGQKVFRPMEQWQPEKNLRTNWVIIRKMKGRDRLFFIWASLFPSAEYIQWKYRLRHKWLVPVFQVVRWAEAGRRAVKIAVIGHE